MLEKKIRSLLKRNTKNTSRSEMKPKTSKNCTLKEKNVERKK